MIFDNAEVMDGYYNELKYLYNQDGVAFEKSDARRKLSNRASDGWETLRSQYDKESLATLRIIEIEE